MKELTVDVKNLLARTEKLYIYGTGMYARNIYELLHKEGIEIDAWVVTALDDNTELYGYPILESKNAIKDNAGIILGLNRKNDSEVTRYLTNIGCKMFNVIHGFKYLDRGGNRGYGNRPLIEITTRIGCSINCKFCPQDLLLSKYFKKNKNRETLMSLDNFIQCIKKLPQNSIIEFAGMGEPFLNPDCMKMISVACESGRDVIVYTTLVGASMDDVKKLCELSISYMALHVADKFKYANIPVTQEYLEKLDFIANAKRKDGLPVVNLWNAQTEPDDEVKKNVSGKHEVLTALNDRAGNLEADHLIKKRVIGSLIRCSMCGEAFDHNVILPDGTVLLCPQDYGMKHVLGNLFYESYQDIINSSEMEKVKKGCNGDCSIEILCRSCSSASPFVENT